LSLPDYLLEEPEICDEHGRELPCYECRLDSLDLRADWAVQDALDERESNP